jgi:choline dehydrogenase-like flavoprotein
LFDVVIVGSGPAGVAAAYELRGRKVCVVDVGKSPLKTTWEAGANFYEVRRNPEPHWNEFVGKRFEGFHNIDKTYIPPKLKAPPQRFITEGTAVLAPIESETFDAIVSLAQGGLANAWGAQLYRYNETDLQQFSLEKEVLEPYYDLLTSHIGISGATDDLTKFYGPADGLLPPLRLSGLAEDLMRRYNRHRSYFNKHGIFLGRPRLGVLSVPHRGRTACDYSNLEFYTPLSPYIYTPRITLEELIRDRHIEYMPGYFVVSLEDNQSEARVLACNLATGQMKKIVGQRVLLAAGALGSAAIVLRTFGDRETRLPIMENLASYVPFINPHFIGKAHETRTFYTQLSLCYLPEAAELVTGTFYSIHGMFHSEFIRDLPLSLSSNLKLLRYILPSMLVLHLWRPGRRHPDNYIALRSNGSLYINYTGIEDRPVEKKLIRAFRRVGYLSAMFLSKYPKPGASVHYAGTLPMRKRPAEKYETHLNGRLHSMKNIFVADGAVFPVLPAKNLSFTIMANAMRVAASLFKDTA